MNKKLEEIKKMIKGRIWLFWDQNTWSKEEKRMFKEQGKSFEWDGKSRVAFIAENPSDGKRPGNLLNFKRFLDENDFSGAFVTDLRKRRGEKPKNKFWDTRDAEILKKEIDVVKPYFIVAIGNNAEKILRNSKNNLDIPVEKIRHYSRTKHAKLKKEIKRIAKIYGNLAKQQGA